MMKRSPRVVCWMLALALTAAAGCGSVRRPIVALPSPTPAPTATPSPSLPGFEQLVRDNSRYLDRRVPTTADAAGLQGAAAGELGRAFQELRASGAFDEPSVRATLAARPSFDGARVHAPLNERLFTRSPSAVVVLERGSACLIGEHGPQASEVHVVGRALDGGCEAIRGR